MAISDCGKTKAIFIYSISKAFVFFYTFFKFFVHYALFLLANALASSLLLKPHFLSASFNLVGLPLLSVKGPSMPPKRAANDILRPFLPDDKGGFKLDPSVLL